MWREWFPSYKVPKIIDRLVDAGILQDKSKEWDYTPHFEATVLEGKIVLWIDHPSVASRYFDDGPRYIINFNPDDDAVENILATNSLDEVLFFLEQLFSQGKGLRLL